MRLRNQRGCLRCTRRKTGPSYWEFLWRENDSDGNRTRRTAVIGTVEQLPSRDLAESPAEPMLVPAPLDRLPWEFAKDEFAQVYMQVGNLNDATRV
jgi:hypothetical protein